MRLTEHFTLEEFTRSQAADNLFIDNTPDEYTITKIQRTAESLETVRAILGSPIIISSGYRSAALNLAVGGSLTSAHVDGLAADFVSPGFGTPLEICKRLALEAEMLLFDQLIFERSGGSVWVHYGLAKQGKMPRGQVLTIADGKTTVGLP